MNPSTPISALRSRWWLVPLLVAVGAVLAAIPQPEQVGTASTSVRYRATNTMLLNDPSSVNSANGAVAPSQVALFATTGDVPQRVKEAIAYGGNAAQLATEITVVFDPRTTALTFTTTQDSADRAELIADTFAQQTNAFLAERQDRLYQDRLAASIARLDELTQRLDQLTADLASRPDDQALLAERDAVSRQYSVAYEQNDALLTAPTLLAFSTLASAQAVPVDAGGLGTPQSRTSRALLGALVGAVLAVGIATLLGRLDRRIRSREHAEEATGLRARVVVPLAGDPDAASSIITPTRHDPLADSYRTLRNVVGFVHGSLRHLGRGHVTLVVSAGPGEGKTTVVTNLAATLAETGQRVVAVNTDFRKPQLSKRLESGSQPLGFTLEETQWLAVTDLLRPTALHGVALLDLDRLGTPDVLARTTATLIPRLSAEADNIVIDTSPMSVTAEVLELVPVADVIVVVVRLDRTDVNDLQRMLNTLRDLTSAPMVLVVVGERHAFTYYRRSGYGLRYGRRYGYGYGYGYGSTAREPRSEPADDDRAELE